MSIFKKKQSVPVCGMCGKADFEGCGSAEKHVEQIAVDKPAWLPPNLRSQGVGEYTWCCSRCNSYPNMKWPGVGGASASMTMHLGVAHHAGEFANMPMPVNFEMVPLR